MSDLCSGAPPGPIEERNLNPYPDPEAGSDPRSTLCTLFYDGQLARVGQPLAAVPATGTAPPPLPLPPSLRSVPTPPATPTRDFVTPDPNPYWEVGSQPRVHPTQISKPQLQLLTLWTCLSVCLCPVVPFCLLPPVATVSMQLSTLARLTHERHFNTRSAARHSLTH